MDDCRLFVICSILLNGGAIFDVGVFGSPFISNGSSFVELLFDIINGDDKFVLVVNFDERGDAPGTLCGVVEPAGGCCPEDNAFELLFGVEVERCEGVIGSSLHEEDDDGPPLIPLPGRYARFKCRVMTNSSPSIPEEKIIMRKIQREKKI